MLPIEELLQETAKNAHLSEHRRVLSDALRSEGEGDLADAAEGTTGEELLRRAAALSSQLGLHLGIRLLWCAYHVLPRLNLRTPAQVNQAGNPQVVITPRNYDPDANATMARFVQAGLMSRQTVQRTLGAPIHVAEGASPVSDANADQWAQLAGVMRSQADEMARPTLVVRARDDSIRRDPLGSFRQIVASLAAGGQAIQWGEVDASPEDQED